MFSEEKKFKKLMPQKRQVIYIYIYWEVLTKYLANLSIPNLYINF